MDHPGSTVAHVVLPGRPAWTPTGITVRRGDRVTLLGSGHIRWSADHGGGARHHLRGRVADGEVFGCPRDTTTVVADRSGPLELRVHLGAWDDGTDRGALAVTVLHWAAGVDPVDGLAALPPGTADPALVAAERERLLDPVVPPAGWSYPPGTGAGEVFRHGRADGRPAIDVVCDDDAGVVTRAVPLDLGPGAALDWSWRVRSLPGTGPENSIWTHDHLSIAVLFDSGRSLAWFWSATLSPDEDTFACPVPGRTDRDTHVPVRRGPAGLGHWRRESRDIWADHDRFVGPPPARVEAVRLIAVSQFGHGSAHATFRDIVLRSGREQIRVL
jgi:hypothetical protein